MPTSAEGGRAVPVDDPDDPRVADYLGLTDVARRRRVEAPGGETPHGFFLAEGEQVVRRALRAGYRPRSLLLLPSRRDLLRDVEEGLPSDVPVLVAAPEVVDAVTGFHVHRGVLASFERPAPRQAVDVLRSSRRVVVCEELSSTTNLGAVFRNAAGLGVDAVLLDPRCADPLYRRSVRVSMGQVFALPHARLEPWPAALADEVVAAGFDVWALTPDADAEPLDRVGPPDDDARVAVLLGAEGPGLTDEAQRAATRRVRIPMAAGVDSLNVAAAAAVAFWAVGRRPAGASLPAAGVHRAGHRGRRAP